MLIEWVKLIPGIGDLILKLIDRRKMKKSQRAYRRYAHHISPGKYFFRDIKAVINKSFEETNCDYILYLSYHNGTENAIGVPYEKFDLFAFNNKKVPAADFMSGINGVVQEYDALDIISEALIHKYTFEKLKEVDPKFAHLIYKGIEESKFVVTANIRPYNVDMGCVIFISTDKRPSMEDCINCADEIQHLYQNNQ